MPMDRAVDGPVASSVSPAEPSVAAAAASAFASRPDAILALQRSAGNVAVGRLLRQGFGPEHPAFLSFNSAAPPERQEGSFGPTATVRSQRGGPPGWRLDPARVPELAPATSISAVLLGVGPLWPHGYPLVPGVYDAFMDFTYYAYGGDRVVVRRGSDHVVVTTVDIATHARLGPVAQGVWSANWVAAVYPWLMRVTGEAMLSVGGTNPVTITIGGALYLIGQDGIESAAQAGVPLAQDILTHDAGEEDELLAAIGQTRTVLDANAVIELEQRGGGAHAIGARGRVVVPPSVAREVARRGGWTRLQQQFDIEVLAENAAFRRAAADARALGFTPGDADVAAAARTYRLPVATADTRAFTQVRVQQMGIVVRLFTPRIGVAQRRLPAPRR